MLVPFMCSHSFEFYNNFIGVMNECCGFDKDNMSERASNLFVMWDYVLLISSHLMSVRGPLVTYQYYIATGAWINTP